MRHRNHPDLAFSDSGFALVTGLVLLVIVTLLGITSVRTVALQERMAAGSFDRNLALQAAEAALRQGEFAAEQQSKTTPNRNAGFPNFGNYVDANDTCPTAANNSCSHGLCVQPDKDCTPRWLDPNFTGWTNAVGLNLGSLTCTPQYFVEYLGDAFPCSNTPAADETCKRYRVTSRCRQGDGRAEVMLQSVYATN